MHLKVSPGILKRCRRTAWAHQQTFLTPLDDLPRFVDVILTAIPKLEGALVVFDRFAFEPRYDLIPLYAKHGLPEKYYDPDLTLEAATAAEARELLNAVFSEWIDFFFIPTPRKFTIYADHDEYTTFFAQHKGHLNGVVEALTAANFRPVD